jgi:hypothetical protein
LTVSVNLWFLNSGCYWASFIHCEQGRRVAAHMAMNRKYEDPHDMRYYEYPLYRDFVAVITFIHGRAIVECGSLSKCTRIVLASSSSSLPLRNCWTRMPNRIRQALEPATLEEKDRSRRSPWLGYKRNLSRRVLHTLDCRKRSAKQLRLLLVTTQSGDLLQLLDLLHCPALYLRSACCSRTAHSPFRDVQRTAFSLS